MVSIIDRRSTNYKTNPDRQTNKQTKNKQTDKQKTNSKKQKQTRKEF